MFCLLPEVPFLAACSETEHRCRSVRTSTRVPVRLSEGPNFLAQKLRELIHIEPELRGTDAWDFWSGYHKEVILLCPPAVASYHLWPHAHDLGD